METKRKSVKSNYVYNLIFQILNLLLPFITTPYVSRVLQADNIGIYSYTYSIITTFILFGSLGIATYGQKEIAAAGSDRNKISRLFCEICVLKFLTIFISTAIYIPVALLSGRYMIFYLVQIPYFISAALDISWLYQGIEDFKYVAVRNSMVKILSVVAIFLLVRTHNDLILYLLIMCVSQAVGNVPMWIRLPKEVDFVKIRLSDLKKHLDPTMVYFIPSIATQIYAVLDKAMLGMLVGSDAENGYYEQAHKIINMTISIVSSYTVVMRSRMSFLFGQNKTKEIKEHLYESMHFVCFLVCPMMFGLAGIATNLVPWFFGDGYEKVVYLLYAFCPLYLFLGLCLCLGTHILTPSGQQSKSNIGQVAGAVFNLILNAILIPQFHSIGAAIASTATEVIILAVYLHYTKSYIRLRNICRISLKYLIASIVMFIPLFYFSSRISATLINSVILIVIGIIIYIVVLLILRDEYTLKTLKGIWRKFGGVLTGIR